jgi:hypothetical protein
MSDTPPSLSAVSLRLAGQVGQATLDLIAADPGGQADLDQHVGAVRSALADAEAAHGRRAHAVVARAAVDARVGAAGSTGIGDLLSAISRSCPDVPAAEAGQRLPLVLLLHYVCGFLEEAVTGDWWPAPDAQPDWESMRLAALCQLIAEAEAAQESSPRLGARPAACVDGALGVPDAGGQTDWDRFSALKGHELRPLGW